MMHGSALSIDKFVKGLPVPGECKAEDESTTNVTDASGIIPSDSMKPNRMPLRAFTSQNAIYSHKKSLVDIFFYLCWACFSVHFARQEMFSF